METDTEEEKKMNEVYSLLVFQVMIIQSVCMNLHQQIYRIQCVSFAYSYFQSLLYVKISYNLLPYKPETAFFTFVGVGGKKLTIKAGQRWKASDTDF